MFILAKEIGPQSYYVVRVITSLTTSISFLGKVDAQTPSRLCKRNFFKRFNALKEKYPSLSNISSTYNEAKMAATDYQMAKKLLNEAFISSELGRWMEKPLEQDQFSLAELDSF